MKLYTDSIVISNHSCLTWAYDMTYLSRSKPDNTSNWVKSRNIRKLLSVDNIVFRHDLDNLILAHNTMFGYK